MKVLELKSYVWLEDAILTVCKSVFPFETTLKVHSINRAQYRNFPHKDYYFTLESSDAEFHLILRLHHGMFSLWSGTENIKTAKEYSVMRHVYQHGIPSPFPYCFSAKERPFGRAYIIFDAGDGVPWWQNGGSLRTMQEETVESMADQLAKLHSVVPAKHPLLPSIDTTSVLKNLKQRTAALKNQELSTCIKNAMKQLESIPRTHPVVVHGQYELENTLIKNNRIRSIVNWEHAAITERCWDVAFTSISLQQKDDRSLANRFLARYVQQTDAPIKNLDFWEGLVALRHYALSEWIRTLDEKSYSAIVGHQTKLLADVETMKTKAHHLFL